MIKSEQSEMQEFRELKKTCNGFREIAEELGKLINGIIYILNEKCKEPSLDEESKILYHVTNHMILSCGVSLQSILVLTDKMSPQVRDCYSIARSIVETAINCGYVLALGEAAAVEASEHAEQLAYRRLNRESKIGDHEWKSAFQGRIGEDERIRLEALKKKYSTKNGKPVNWPRIPIKDRLQLISASFSTNTMLFLHSSYFGTYELASEITHGSYYSSIFMLGRATPQKSYKSQYIESRMNNLNHQFSTLNDSIFAVIAVMECVKAKFALDFVERFVTNIIARIRNLPSVKRDLENT